MKQGLKQICERHFFNSFTMLAAFVQQCPGSLWHKKLGGFIFWQQLLHALCGVQFWFRLEGEGFQEPFAGKRVYPELEKDAVDQLSRKEIETYCAAIRKQCENFFGCMTDDNLTGNSAAAPELTNLDVILMQIRHLQYHVGHCNSILREQGVTAVKWLE